MKAILLAAGLGTRLRPLTNHIPKCLVPINGKPLLGLWIDKLISLGVTDILINTHYFSEKVENYISSHPKRNHICIVYEESLLGTAGTLLQNKTFWQDDTCFVIHADNYCQNSLHDMLRVHVNRPAEADLTLLVFETNNAKSCGIVKLNPSNIVLEFHEKVENPPGNLASGALFIFSPCVYAKYFESLEHGAFYDLSADIVPKMIGSILSWKTNDVYIDIGTPDNYAAAVNIHKNPDYN